jgi:aminopeptidase N
MKSLISLILILLIVKGVSGLLHAQEGLDADELADIVRYERDANAWKLSPVSVETGANYDVKYYRCWWNIDPAVRAISGNVTTLFAPVGVGLNSLSVDLHHLLTVDSVRYHDNPVNWEHNSDLVDISFSSTLPLQTVDSVTVYYHGVPPNSGSSSFVKTTHNGVPILWTFTLLGRAADWWPCKSTHTDKADSIDIYINTPSAYKTATVGVLVSEMDNGTNTVFHWKHRYPIANYAINIAVTNYARYSHQVDYEGTTLDIVNYVYPEDSAELVTQTGILIPATQLFDSLFGIYPFQNEKYGQAQYGTVGMENQTMTFLSNFSYDVMTHELAHSWFGNKLTCKSWADVWLNEGFAVYLTALCYERYKPGEWKSFLQDRIDFITEEPWGSVYCPDTLDMGRVFDHRLSYEKGAMILHQLRWIMGDSAFFAALKNYANDDDLAYGFVSTSDLKEHLESSCGQDLTWYFNDWYLGEGYPSYTVQVIQSPEHNATVTINQSQSHNSVDFFEMPVPIKFIGEVKDTTIVFNHTFSGEMFEINPGFTISSTEFDPDLWLISANNHVTLGVDDITAAKEIRILPNPAGDILYVQHNTGKVNSIDILNLDGNKESISLKKKEETGIEINIQNLNPGLYLLRIVYNEGIITRKFVKE